MAKQKGKFSRLGYNNDLLSGCKRLHDYSYFISEINENLNQGMSLKEAIFIAMDTCISQDILADILIKNRSDVYQMLLTKYDEQEVLEATYRDGLKEGRSVGIEEGRSAGIEEGRSAGIEEGQNRVNQLNQILLEQNRIEDIKRAIADSSYQKKLFDEFGI